MLWILETLKEKWKFHHRFSNNSNHFVMLDHLMTSGGIRLENGWSQLYKTTRLCLLLGASLMWIRFWFNFMEAGSFGAVMNNIHVSAIVLITLVRAGWIQMNMKAFTEAKNYINGRSFRPHDSSAWEIRRNAYQKNHSLVTICIVSVAALYVPVLLVDSRRIPPLRNPIEVREMTSDGFQLLLDKLYVVTLFPYGPATVTNVMSTYMLLEGFVAEMQIIADAFGEIFDKMTHQTGVEHWRELQASFRTCADQHVICLNHLRNTRSLLNGTLLIVYYTTGFFISIGTVYIMWTKDFEMFKIQILSLMMFNVLECFFFCILVERINNVHNSVGEQLYNIAWHSELKYSKAFEKEYISIRATMMIVMHSADHTLGISCGGLFELGMERFSELMKSSYQLVMFLWNMAGN
ncbi:uncharacterized protein LOC129767043 [Toxorhynchites rutilus septentrionalis]|uniref:uncharacterized protein LOC129767043 n=1 Tax=Toxorhynchites rutilus septentrionalis TaxID=329112 RepID=UPI00247900F9|nr:uncharacterized protein LOC129767043 [Toxorhynchites rutilus septentrionalis]